MWSLLARRVIHNWPPGWALIRDDILHLALDCKREQRPPTLDDVLRILDPHGSSLYGPGPLDG